MSVARSLNADKNACDDLARSLVHMRGGCQYPGCGTVRALQCCHIITRTYAWTRTDLKNLLCLCAKHHRLIDTFPDEKLRVTQHVYGDGHYLRLRVKAEEGVRAKFDWRAERARLNAIAKEMGL